MRRESTSTGSVTWRSCVLLALAALSILLVRPVCDAFGAGVATESGIAAHEHASGGAGHHSHDPDPCCDRLEPFAITAAIGFAVEGTVDAVLVVEVLGRPRVTAWPDVDARMIGHRPRSLSYHARTARILA